MRKHLMDLSEFGVWFVLITSLITISEFLSSNGELAASFYSHFFLLVSGVLFTQFIKPVVKGFEYPAMLLAVVVSLISAGLLGGFALVVLLKQAYPPEVMIPFQITVVIMLVALFCLCVKAADRVFRLIKGYS